MKKALLLIALPITMAYAASSFAGGEEKIKWSQVPAAVQKTITKHAGGGKIEEIEKETETKDGKSVTVYEAKVKRRDGKELEIEVGENGKLIKKEEKIKWSQVPAAVQKTITKHAGRGKIEKIEKETETKDGKLVTVYEAKVKRRDGKELEIEVGENGKLIKIDD